MTNSPYHQGPLDILCDEKAVAASKLDPKDFAFIYKKYFLSIYKYVLVRVENKDLADEIVSKVFSKALSKINQYKSKGLPFSAWLYRIAYNEMNDMFRKKKSNKIVQIPLEQISNHEEKFDDNDAEEREIQLKLLLNGIDQLKPHEIELLEMRYFERRAFKEIGDLLNLTEANAKVKTHRVLNKLRKLILNGTPAMAC